MIGRRCIEHPVFQDMHIAVRALGNPSARTVKHCFLTFRFFCLLRGHHGRNQVQGFDVAVEKARILCRNQTNRLFPVTDSGRIQGNPQISCSLGEGMIPDSRSPRHLIVYKQIAGIHLFDKTVQKVLQFVLRHRHLDLQRRSTSEKPVHMLTERKDLVVSARSGIIYPVSKPGNPVIHGDSHFLQRTIGSIVITKSFHCTSFRSKLFSIRTIRQFLSSAPPPLLQRDIWFHMHGTADMPLPWFRALCSAPGHCPEPLLLSAQRPDRKTY